MYDGVVFVVDLRAGFFDLLRYVVSLRDQAVARVVAGEVGAEAEADVAAALRNEVAQSWRPGLRFEPGFVDVFEE